jgi:hypothetical protein
VTWQIDGGSVSTYQAGAQSITLNPGTHTLTMTDAYGDGWNGVEWEIRSSTGEVIAGPFSLTSGFEETRDFYIEDGQHSSGQWDDTCTACAVGLFSNKVAIMAAHAADPQNNPPNFQKCLDCPIGLFTNSEETAECTECAVGQFQNITGKTSCENCVPCEAGSFLVGCFSEFPGVCTACAAGLYKDAPEAWDAICTGCVAGKFAAHDGTDSCVECPKGKFQHLADQDWCNECATGQYANSLGNDFCTACEACPAGEFKNGCAASVEGACETCPDGTHKATVHTCIGFIYCLL